MCGVTRLSLIGPRRDLALAAVMLFVCTMVVPGRTKARESAESHPIVCPGCTMTGPVAVSSQSGQAAGHLSDPQLQSLERALAEGKAQEAHALLIEILKRPHLSSDTLLRLGIQFAEREQYEEATAAFERCMEDHPEVFEAYYDLALADIAERKWRTR